MAGSAFVFSGSAGGITTGFVFTQTDAAEANEMGDEFGAALAVGDFNGDLIGDLAVGAPGDGAEMAGSVFVFPGSSVGITPGFRITHQDQEDLEDVLPDEPGDDFGAALAAADFTGDGFAELVVGAPGKAVDLAPAPKAGTACIFRGSGEGITTAIFFEQKGNGGFNEAGDRFAAALAPGDFNGDGFEDLAVGVPDEALGAKPPTSGAVFVVGAGEIQFFLR